MTLELGQTAPDFTLIAQDRSEVTLSSFRGSKTMVVFMPWPFSDTCTGEACTIRDNLGRLNQAEFKVLMITCHPHFTNKHWSEINGFTFPVLADFWPHGEVSKAYGAFDERFGVSRRATFFIDEDGVITDVIASGSIKDPRDFPDYDAALG